ncbi:DUF2799 domain-containing protein [Roseobacter sp. HKCCA0434]|uniref:DUF2799 domain-containing protein n=1 Tax=Roseobacter sp. HKCCA0434 TaxID=3079297 RepID=UPI002905D893|nr:DUF2799 domain-containing protein [Roseobacter sp. HKCCA0434]
MRYILSLVALTLLASCASLSEDECRLGDWRSIGFEDGSKGLQPDFVANHREACAEFGVSPDLNAYLAGRELGLREYCVPIRAYRLGREGRPISNVCPATIEPVLRDANAHGREYFRLSGEIRALEREIAELRSSAVAPDAPNAGTINGSLNSSILSAQSRINILRARRLIYASWP